MRRGASASRASASSLDDPPSLIEELRSLHFVDDARESEKKTALKAALLRAARTGEGARRGSIRASDGAHRPSTPSDQNHSGRVGRGGRFSDISREPVRFVGVHPMPGLRDASPVSRRPEPTAKGGI